MIGRIAVIRDSDHRRAGGKLRRFDMPMRQISGQQKAGQKSKEAAGTAPENAVQHRHDAGEMAGASSLVKPSPANQPRGLAAAHLVE